MTTTILFDADLGVTELGRKRRATVKVSDVVAELFGDDFARALYRETAYEVPAGERSTCPVHQDWRTSCQDLHDDAAAA